jgi:hypothetical protein
LTGDCAEYNAENGWLRKIIPQNGKAQGPKALPTGQPPFCGSILTVWFVLRNLDQKLAESPGIRTSESTREGLSDRQPHWAALV